MTVGSGINVPFGHIAAAWTRSGGAEWNWRRLILETWLAAIEKWWVGIEIRVGVWFPIRGAAGMARSC